MDEFKLKILLIEDDKAIAKVIVMELEHQGHQVFLSADGVKGLERAASLLNVFKDEAALSLPRILQGGGAGAHAYTHDRDYDHYSPHHEENTPPSFSQVGLGNLKRVGQVVFLQFVTSLCLHPVTFTFRC